MTSKIKTALLTFAALTMTAGVSVAAPGKHSNNGYGNKYSHSYKQTQPKKFGQRHGASGFERAAIARSAANLSALKARAWRDGRLTFSERAQIRNAEQRHAALVRRAYRS